MKNNTMIVGGYTLHLYCDNKEKHYTIANNGYYFIPETTSWIHVDNEFVGETYGECVKEARSIGWLVNRRKDKCLCKYCR
jgi:hypothetical protein